MQQLHTTRFIATFVVFALIAGSAAAQEAASPTFEVASVKPNKAGFGSPQRARFEPGDRIDLVNVPLVMLRNLLTERFKLVTHTETRTEPIWAIVLARRDGKLGPQLHRAAASCVELRSAVQTIDKGQDPCGGGTFATALMTGIMHVRGFPLDQLGIVAMEVGRRRVIDKTGLTGTFDWDLTWTPQRFLQGSVDREQLPNIDPNGPSVFTALQEQLGLKLESQEGDDTVLVIDSVYHPTEN